MPKKESTKKKPSKAKKPSAKRMPRPFKVTVTFNRKEYEMILSYIDRHNVENKSKFVREILMLHLWEKVGDQQPRLFQDEPTL